MGIFDALTTAVTGLQSQSFALQNISGNIVVGIIGALVASWILPQLHIQLATGTVGAIVDATIGAVIVLVILSLIKRV